MKITKVSAPYGTVVRRVDLADMEGVEFRRYPSSRHACRPSAVIVTWDVPLRPAAEVYDVEVEGSRILKSGALGDQETKRCWRQDGWPDWLVQAVEASRPVLQDLQDSE